jgi:drug/metabolite transporter (DMT)-like permease
MNQLWQNAMPDTHLELLLASTRISKDLATYRYNLIACTEEAKSDRHENSAYEEGDWMHVSALKLSRSTVGGFIAILLWSATFAFARSLSEKVGPLTAGAAVYIIGGALCLLRFPGLAKPQFKFSKLPLLYLVGCGSLFVFYTAAIYLAVGIAKDRLQLLEVALVNYLWPTLTILLSLVLLKKKGTFWLVPGTVLALAGVFMVMSQGSAISGEFLLENLRHNRMAYVLALSAAISWALYSNLARRWTTPDNSGALALFLPATGLFLLVLCILRKEPSCWSIGAGAEALGLAAMTALSYSLWDLAMRKGDLLLVVACSYFVPMLSTGVSCLYLKISASPRLWIGCLLLVSGSLVTWLSVLEPPVRLPKREE